MAEGLPGKHGLWGHTVDIWDPIRSLHMETQPSTGSHGFTKWGPGAGRSGGDGGAQQGLQYGLSEAVLVSRPEIRASQWFNLFDVKTQEGTGSTRRL